jgi:O-Antigen ligase
VKRPVWALYVFVVGLALHNVVMAELWAAGVRGTALEVVSAWKEVLLAVALALVVIAQRRLPYDGRLTDRLALLFAAFVIVYGLLPQSWLDGGATHKGVLYGARNDLVPVAAYFLGRGLELTRRDFRRLGATIAATGAAVAAFGLIDVYAIPLSWWRSSGAPGWFFHQLGFSDPGLSNLPENFVYNLGNNHVLRRLVSTFLSPLASSYLFVVALLFCAAWWNRRRPHGAMLAAWIGTVALLLGGLLWTHSRSSQLALAGGLVAMALVRRQDAVWLAAAAACVLVLGAVFVKAYPHIGPRTSFTPAEQKIQEANAAGKGSELTASGYGDSSLSSHWRNLRDGLKVDFRHPQGYGLGNAGSTAARTGVTIKAGESTYTELGVDTGLLGALAFIAWSLALTWRVLPRIAWVGAALVSVLLLGLQTDVLGVPWLAYVVWSLAGGGVDPPPALHQE